VKPHDPHTSAEWQEAVDAAAGLRMIAACKMYGLLDGGPEIDVARCDKLLKAGAARGVRPSRTDTELAVALVGQFNAQTSRTASVPSSEVRRR
jgi:hypothetical protein